MLRLGLGLGLGDTRKDVLGTTFTNLMESMVNR